MDNFKQQESLDKRKYKQSLLANADLSGQMDYCSACAYQADGTCTAAQDKREKLTLCATAYNKKHRSHKQPQKEQ